PEKWMEYQEKFGRGSLYDLIISSTDALARDVAILEIMGPYPEATLRLMERLEQADAGQKAIEATGGKASRLAEKARHAVGSLQALYDTVSGRAAISDNNVVGSISQGNRNVITSAVLGSASLFATADLVTQALTARFNGVPIHRVLARHLKGFVTAGVSTRERQLALNLGFGAQSWASRAIAAQR